MTSSMIQIAEAKKLMGKTTYREALKAAEANANARLIAAAPALLAACTNLLAACDDQAFSNGVTGHALTAMEEARTAIKEATP